MEQNTAVIGIEEYYKLRQFHEKLADDFIASYYSECIGGYRFLTKDESIIELQERLEESRKQKIGLENKVRSYQDIKDYLERKIKELSKDIPVILEVNPDELKNLSIWQFIKWRSQQRKNK